MKREESLQCNFYFKERACALGNVRLFLLRLTRFDTVGCAVGRRGSQKAVIHAEWIEAVIHSMKN